MLLSWWCLFGARKRTLAGHTVLKMDRLIPASTRLCIIRQCLKNPLLKFLSSINSLWMRRGYVGCGVAMLGCGVAMLGCGVAMSLGCGVAMWLARRAAVRQSRVRIPPGSPPLVQPRKIQEQKSIGADFSQRSSRRISPSPRMNIVSIL